MHGEGLPKFENPPAPPKRTRAAKQLGPDEIIKQLEGLSLDTQLGILTMLRKIIDERKMKLQQDLELINGNLK